MKKRLFIQLMVAASALMTMVACGGQGKNASTEENDSTAIEETQVVEEQKVSTDVVKGELGMFDLRGPVKECTIKGDDHTTTHQFNEEGFATVIYGQPLKDMFKTIKRDAEGRMQHCSYDEYDETHCDYKVNEAGLIIETEDWPFMDGGSNTKYTYDDNGDLTQISVTELGMDGEGAYVTKYTIEERDTHGNWTRRKANGKTETRVITYYE